ncbi:MAG: hypothetical protein JF621_23255 [Streptomyces turgidiscabies]|nr:hypothetical protein [Streptomyces turgidiscabies]
MVGQSRRDEAGGGLLREEQRQPGVRALLALGGPDGLDETELARPFGTSCADVRDAVGRSGGPR